MYSTTLCVQFILRGWSCWHKLCTSKFYCLYHAVIGVTSSKHEDFHCMDNLLKLRLTSGRHAFSFSSRLQSVAVSFTGQWSSRKIQRSFRSTQFVWIEVQGQKFGAGNSVAENRIRLIDKGTARYLLTPFTYLRRHLCINSIATTGHAPSCPIAVLPCSGGGQPVSAVSGFSQGSFLVPILWYPFVNDLPDILMGNVLLFADDVRSFAPRSQYHHTH